jgi:hypothetical protein
LRCEQDIVCRFFKHDGIRSGGFRLVTRMAPTMAQRNGALHATPQIQKIGNALVNDFCICRF